MYLCISNVIDDLGSICMCKIDENRGWCFLRGKGLFFIIQLRFSCFLLCFQRHDDRGWNAVSFNWSFEILIMSVMQVRYLLPFFVCPILLFTHVLLPTICCKRIPQTVVCSMPALQLIGFVWLRFKVTGMFCCYVRLHVYKVMLCCQEMRTALATTTKRLFVTVVTTSLPPHFGFCRRLQRKMKWRTRLALVSNEVTFFKWFIIYTSWFKDEFFFSILKVPCLQCYTWKNGMALFKCLTIKY